MRLVDERAERAVLAALIVRPACWQDVAGLVDPDSFGHPDHARLASALWALRRAGESDVDLVVLGAELDRQGSRSAVAPLLDALTDEVVAVAPLRHARRCRDLAAARRLHELLGTARDETRAAEDDPTAWLEHVARRVVAAADVRRESELLHIGTHTERHIRELEGRASGALRGTPTGIEALDAMTGGLHSSEYTVVAARPSCGKSALAMQIATHVTEPVAFFSSEMRAIAVMDRLVAERGNVNLSRIRDGRLTSDEMHGVIEAYRKLRASKVWISDRRGWRVNEIVAQVRTWKRAHCTADSKPVVIVDYLQRVKASQRHSSREQEVAEISGTFADLAGEENVSLIVLAQLGRIAENRGADVPPQLSDLRESGAIEQDADGVWFVHRPDRLDTSIEAGAAILSIAKQRQGECGMVPLWFQGSYQRFAHRPRDYVRTSANPESPATRPARSRSYSPGRDRGGHD